MKLLIDIGNTRSKMAVTQGDDVLHTEHLAEPWVAALARLHDSFKIDAVAVSCVGSEGTALRDALAARGETALWLDATTPCAISGVPTGYGADRLAADIGAYTGQHALLVIDAGTCITYDLIVDGRLAGGVISPGVQLRLNAMHDYTAALPLVRLEGGEVKGEGVEPPLVADNTHDCMVSAAVHGARFEAEGYIRSLLAAHPDLEVVTTGGTDLHIDANIPHRHDALLVFRGLNKIITS